MRTQMLEKNASCYVNWKDEDVKQKDAQLDAWYATHDDFDHTLD